MVGDLQAVITKIQLIDPFYLDFTDIDNNFHLTDEDIFIDALNQSIQSSTSATSILLFQDSDSDSEDDEQDSKVPSVTDVSQMLTQLKLYATHREPTLIIAVHSLEQAHASASSIRLSNLTQSKIDDYFCFQ